MEPDLTPDAVPGDVPESASIPVPAPANAPAPREHPHAPLLHKGFTRLFWLNLAEILINVLSNTFKLTERIPALRVPLSIIPLVISVLIVVTVWQMQRAVPRFRKAAVWSVLPLAAAPLFALLDLQGMAEKISAADAGMAVAALVLLLAALLGIDAMAQYQRLTGSAEAFDGYDDGFARKWRTLRSWMVASFLLLDGFLVLTVILMLSQGAFFYLSGGMVLLFILLAIMLGLAVMSIIVLVYLYRAARLF